MPPPSSRCSSARDLREGGSRIAVVTIDPVQACGAAGLVVGLGARRRSPSRGSTGRAGASLCLRLALTGSRQSEVVRTRGHSRPAGAAPCGKMNERVRRPEVPRVAALPESRLIRVCQRRVSPAAARVLDYSLVSNRLVRSRPSRTIGGAAFAARCGARHAVVPAFWACPILSSPSSSSTGLIGLEILEELGVVAFLVLLFGLTHRNPPCTVILMPGSPPVHAAAGASPAGRDFKIKKPRAAQL